MLSVDVQKRLGEFELAAKFESAGILQRLVNEEGVLAARLVKQGRLKAE